ncbi:MAG: hypothetical protein GY783_00355 [Gammaproteobacteria bacterium]|nr:hypothetical protein [Gammaproteobacteria bacterium]
MSKEEAETPFLEPALAASLAAPVGSSFFSTQTQSIANGATDRSRGNIRSTALIVFITKLIEA